MIGEKRLQRIKDIQRLKFRQRDMKVYELRLLTQEITVLSEKIQHYSDSYQQGVSNINKLRSSPDRQAIEIFENSIDHIMNKWMDAFRESRQLEKKRDSLVLSIQVLEKQIAVIEENRSSLEIENKKIIINRSFDDELIKLAARDIDKCK